ncbi:hypothetical protein MMC32_008135 [Xylographa parallela]|nr:hypothetical protein [Xylographa parallela]
MVRDYDSWMDKSIREKVESMIESNRIKHKKDTRAKKELEPLRPTRVGLCIAIYEPDLAEKIGEPDDKVLCALSIVVAVIQLGVATIPCGIFGDWGILLVTACGILLSSATASLPQWQVEKWACRSLRKGSNKKIVLTKGNGSQHAIVVIGVGGFLDLEDLATGQTNLDVSTSVATKIAVMALAILWASLLVTASGLKENTWFLLSVGGIGIVFNIYVAGRSSDPRSVGIPLKFKAVIASPKVMQALYDVEEVYPKLGRSMLETFFPGRLRDDERKAWDMYDKKASLNEAEMNNQRDGQQVVSSTPES